MRYHDPAVASRLLTLEGIPLTEARELLPQRSRWSPGLAAHLHLHARAQRSGGDEGAPARVPRAMTLLRHEALVDHLRRTVRGLRLSTRDTTWSGYDRETSYSAEAAEAKERLVERMLGEMPAGRVLDIGANRGRFARLAEAAGHRVVAIDADWAPMDELYRSIRGSGSTITPLVVDLVSPTPAAGWGLRERPSFLERARADTILALALVHHLAIGRNVPLAMVAEQFASLAQRALVEFVPREDPMVERLLRDREDVFDDYTRAGFEAAFGSALHDRGAARDPRLGPRALPVRAPMSLRSATSPIGPWRRIGLVPAYPVVLGLAWVVDSWVHASAPLSGIWRPLLVVGVAALAVLAASLAIWRRRMALGAYVAGAFVTVVTLQWPIGGPMLRGGRVVASHQRPAPAPSPTRAGPLPGRGGTAAAQRGERGVARIRARHGGPRGRHARPAAAVRRLHHQRRAPERLPHHGRRLPAGRYARHPVRLRQQRVPRRPGEARLHGCHPLPFERAADPGHAGHDVQRQRRRCARLHADELRLGRPAPLHAAISDGALLSRLAGERLPGCDERLVVLRCGVSNADVVLDGGELSEWETSLIQRSMLAG